METQSIIWSLLFMVLAIGLDCCVVMALSGNKRVMSISCER